MVVYLCCKFIFGASRWQIVHILDDRRIRTPPDTLVIKKAVYSLSALNAWSNSFAVGRDCGS